MRFAMAMLLVLTSFAGVAQAIPASVIAAGQPVKGAEVCIWKAGRPSNPITRFFASSDTTCGSADADMPIPPGEWNLFARKAPHMVSDEVVLLTDAARPQQIVLKIVPAVLPDLRALELIDSEHSFAYIAHTHAALPLDGKTPIPIGATITPVVITKSRVVRIGRALRVEQGKPASLVADSPTANHSHVVVPVLYTSVPKGKFAAPELTATDASGRLTPTIARLAPIRDSVELTFARNLPVGSVTIELHGERWKTATAHVDLPAKSNVFVVESPITTSATSRVIVHWWTPTDFRSLVQTPQPCAEKDPNETDVSTTFAAAVMRCPGQKPGMPINSVRRAECVSVTEQTLSLNRREGIVEFADVPAGLYFLRFTVPALPTIYKSIDVPEDESFRSDAELRYATFFGKIKRDGKPAHARFFGTVSNPDTGEYVAVLTAMPRSGIPTPVLACDGSWYYMAVFDVGPTENAAFDIDVPKNRIEVHVVDETTGAAIEKAAVTLGAATPGSSYSADFSGDAGQTDASGELVIEPVVDNRMLLVCASDSSHESKCADRFTMKDTPEKTVLLSLPRIVKHQGRLVNAGPVTLGSLKWFTNDGRMTEVVSTFAGDGTFTYQRRHNEGEIVVLTTPSTPLYAFLQPRLDVDEPFLIEIPTARRRTFSVTLSPDSKEKVAFVALSIGGVVVPVNALGNHMHSRHLQSALLPGWTATIPDVLETGPITVILVPGSFMEQFPPESQIQLPLVPSVGSLPRQQLGERDTVTFP